MNSIPEKIKEICKNKNRTQEFLAEKLGITQSALSQKLARGDEIKFKLLLDIANILQIDVVDIIKYPQEYVLKKDCENCKEKDRAIKNLNDYIDLLTKHKKK